MIYLKILEVLNSLKKELCYGLRQRGNKMEIHPLKFIDKSLKINAEYYKMEILASNLVPHEADK